MNNREYVVAQAVAYVNEVMDLDARNLFVDMLPEDTRAYLFAGYVLKEHYDSLEKRLFTVTASNALLTDIVRHEERRYS